MPTHASDSGLIGSPENPLEVIDARFNRTVLDLRGTALEAGRVRFADRKFWFFGSELACLRLMKAYRHLSVDKARSGFSENLTTHYFVLETPGLTSAQDLETPDELPAVFEGGPASVALKDFTEAEMRQLFADVWRNCPAAPSSAGPCAWSCGHGVASIGGGICLHCAREGIAALVGGDLARRYLEAVRSVRNLESEMVHLSR